MSKDAAYIEEATSRLRDAQYQGCLRSSWRPRTARSCYDWDPLSSNIAANTFLYSIMTIQYRTAVMFSRRRGHSRSLW